jgi:FAD/FMN-containing dehydrogenase
MTEMLDRTIALGTACAEVYLPGDPGYDTARTPWNVAVDLRPAAVAAPRTTAEVAAVVRAAAAAGLRVAPQGTGHNAGPLTDLSDVVLLRTHHMRGAVVDTKSGIATVGAGTLWEEAVIEADARGCAVLHGSSPDVGVVGYSLGGGMGWYARALGLATNSITGAEVVTATGDVIRVDAEHEPDLFWALRGGGGNLGVVTSLDFRTYPFTTAYAGMLVWDWAHADAVVRRWAEWATTAPDSVTTSLRLMQLPPFPEIPEPVRGRRLVVIDGAVLTADDDAARILAPLRELRPEIDTFGRTDAASLVRLHMDPEGPTPAVSDAAMLGSLPPDGIDALLSAAGPGSGTSLLFTELRQLGGALARPAQDGGALPCLDGQFVLFGVAIAATPDMAARGHRDAQRVTTAMAPWSNGRQYLNFAETAVDTGSGYETAHWDRLRRIRAAADPTGLFVANHPVR